MRKFIGLAVLALLLCMAPSSPAAVYRHAHVPLINSTGEALTGVTYHFYTPGTTDTVAVYSDRAGTRSYHGDGFETGADGMIDKFVTDGCYDIAYVHSGRNISGTLDGYCWGAATGDTLRATVIMPASGDTTYGYASDATDDGVFKIKGIHLRNVWGPSDSRSLWFGKLGQPSGRYIMAMGGTDGKPSVMFSYYTTIDYVFEDGNDRTICEVDTSDVEAGEGEILFQHTRGTKGKWCVKSGTDSLGIAWRPDVGMRWTVDIPDTTGDPATLVRIRHPQTADTDLINTESCLLDMYDGSTAEYKFMLEGLALAEGNYILIGGGTGYTKIGHTDDTSSYINANSQLLNIRDDDGSDDATVDVNGADIDTLDITGFAVGTGPPQLLTASVHKGQFCTNAAGDTLYWSNGTAWTQIAP